VTPFGAVRFAWSVPDNLQYFKYAKLVLIPHGAGGEGQVHIIVCPAQNNDPVVGPNCITPPGVAYPGPPNRLVEVDISGLIGPSVGAPGTGYLAVLAYTTPNIATDHIVGLRFEYEPRTPNGVATTGANTFSGTQTAPAFVGDGSGLTGLPFPAGAATLGTNTFSGTQTAPAFAGSGASLTGVAKLSANIFSGTQTIDAGNLDLDDSTATTGNITKNGERFLHGVGSNNTFLGVVSGNLTMSGSENTAIGAGSFFSNTTGYSNTVIGVNNLVSNTEGAYNTAIGRDALFSNSTGSDNTANGGATLYSNTTGIRNAAFGTAALFSNTTGSNNTAVGNGAGGFGTTGSNNIYLGALAYGSPGESNTIYLGVEWIHTRTLIAGIRGITTGEANAVPVVIDSNGQLGTVSSSIRFKEDIHDMADVSQRLMMLRPVTFRYTQAYRNGAKPIQYGLIAEEVAEVFPELAVRGADGQVETVHYETLNVLLLNEFQKQAQDLAEQAQRIDALERMLREIIATRRD
jgi:hypothetical protein